MKILVTGGAGYIGSLLIESLLSYGHEVSVIDKFSFGIESLKNTINHPNLKIFIEDLLTFKKFDILSNIDCIVHLAAIVGDPACAVDSNLAIKTNVEMTRTLVDEAINADIKKFVFCSTCSVYGQSKTPTIKLDERGDLNPVSLYAETKIKGENYLLERKNEFQPIILRLGTLFGMSYRPRFDLVINFLTGQLYFENEGVIYSGEQWRPFVHVKDIVNAFIIAIESENSKISGEIFNVGSNDLNLQMKELIPIFRNTIPQSKISLDQSIIDQRSYNIDFTKINRYFNYATELSIEDGINEIINSFKLKYVTNFRDLKYRNYSPPHS